MNTPTAGPDTLIGNASANIIDGLGGDDSINGGMGNDTLRGGLGNDSLDGGAGADSVDGGDGNDTLNYEPGNAPPQPVADHYSGGPGTDTLVLHLTMAQWLDSATQLQIAAARAQLASTGDATLSISNQTLSVDQVEQFSIFVDRVYQNPASEPVTARDDAYNLSRYASELKIYFYQLLSNDDVPDLPSALTLEPGSGPAHGSVLLAASPLNPFTKSTITYQPDASYFAHLALNQTEEDRFSYRLTDADGSTDTADVRVTMRGLNDAPVAAPDAAVGGMHDILNIHVLDNDTDVDDNAVLTVVSVSVPAGKGRAEAVGRDIVSFYPGISFDTLPTGSTEDVTLSYTVKDEYGAKSSSTVTVTVHGPDQPPVGQNTQVGIIEDQGYAIRPGDFSFTDADSPGTTLQSVKITALPRAGVLLFNNVPLVLNAEVSVADMAAGRLIFVPQADSNADADASSDADASFKFAVRNDASWSTLALSSNTYTFHITPDTVDFVTNLDPLLPYSRASALGVNFSIQDPQAVGIDIVWDDNMRFERFGENLEISDPGNGIHWTILGQFPASPGAATPYFVPTLITDGEAYTFMQGAIGQGTHQSVLVGSSADDTLRGGNDHYNLMFGAGGDDVLIGGDAGNSIWANEGNDVVFGFYNEEIFDGPGNDTLWLPDGSLLHGGDGADVLVLPAFNNSGVYVQNFDAADSIRLIASGFPDAHFATGGALASDDFLLIDYAIGNLRPAAYGGDYRGEHFVATQSGQVVYVYYVNDSEIVLNDHESPVTNGWMVGRLEMSTNRGINNAPVLSSEDFVRGIAMAANNAHVFTLEDFGLGGGQAKNHETFIFDQRPDNGVMLLDNQPFLSIGEADIAAGRLTFVPTANQFGESSIAFHTTYYNIFHQLGVSPTVSIPLGVIPDNPIVGDSAAYSLNGVTGNTSIFDTGGSNDGVTLSGYGDIVSLNLGRFGDNLEVTGAGTDDAFHLSLVNQYTADAHVETITFSDGGRLGSSLDSYTLQTTAYSLQSGVTGGTADEILAGTTVAESLSGGAGNDLLFGNAGNDTLSGGDGSDYLSGGAGNDVYIGGAGDDWFVLDSRIGLDSITDFDIGHDWVMLNAGVFSDSVFVNGTLQSADLLVIEPGDTPGYAGQHFVFTKSLIDDGTLYYFSTADIAQNTLDRGANSVPLLDNTNEVAAIHLVGQPPLNYASFLRG